jgi:hypothetical protein
MKAKAICLPLSLTLLQAAALGAAFPPAPSSLGATSLVLLLQHAGMVVAGRLPATSSVRAPPHFPLLPYSSSPVPRQSSCSHGALPSSHISHGTPAIFSLSYVLLPWRPRPACQLYVFCYVCFELQLVIEASASLNPCLLVLLQHCMPSVRLNASKVRLSLFFSLLPISQVCFTMAFLAVLADSLREGGTDHSKWMCHLTKFLLLWHMNPRPWQLRCFFRVQGPGRPQSQLH